jgi:choloylglycine hydrolase
VKKLSICLSVVISAFFSVTTNYACTDFRVVGKDHSVVIARSMEFAMDLKSELWTTPRGQAFATTAPDGKPGMSWKAQYGYAFLNGLGQDFVVDGLNEKGLSFEALYLPGETQYQTVPAGHNNQALAYAYLGHWILGNFQNITEVRKTLSSLYVFAQKLPGLGDFIFPLHFAIYDSSGNGIIVEYVNGQMQLHENKVGIMTNSPLYDWQITNLRNYLNLSPYSPDPISAGSITFSATGQGAGMIGLPGDVSPPSRFVKVAFLLKYANPIEDAAGALNLAEHVINNVDIPMGAVRVKQADGSIAGDYTQWVVFKDLTHKTLYFRTYQNLTLRSVALEKLDFSSGAARLKMTLDSPPMSMDVTQQLMAQKG